MPTLTINRVSPIDPIRIPLALINRANGQVAWEDGLFDTGNDHTVISRALFTTLGLAATGGSVIVNGVTGSSQAAIATVSIQIRFDDGQPVTIQAHEVGVVAGASDAVLIGRDFLKRFDVTISRGGVFTLTL